MKENSREEDMKILEKLINTMKSDRELFDEKIDKEIYAFFINALEHILQDYKRVLKENEEYKKAVNVVNKEKEDWIRAYQEEKDKQFDLINKTFQKVKDKIEEYKNMLKTCNKVKDIDRIKAINERILELEELLEGRK